MDVESLIIRHEGIRLKPYRCPSGKLTIGVGRNLEDNGITQPEAIELFKNDLARCQGELSTIFPGTPLDEVRQAVLLDMLFNLGYPRFLEFKKLISAVRANDWFRVAQEMQDSLWATQVGNRATELIWMMRNGRWLEE